jgi:hypothetical protein
MSPLEDYLVLARYVHDLLGAESFDELKGLLRLVDEGPGDDGQSHFYGRLATQPRLKVPQDRLREYDRRVMEYERRLARVRQDFKGWRYFQYLALVYAEIFLDRLTDDPVGLLASLNAFLEGLRQREADLREMPDFRADDLRRFAFFMATGSGKTLLLHVNVLQVLHYMEHGRHPEALVRRADGRRMFNSVLLITPNEGLSDQHIAELRASGIEAVRFIDSPTASSLFGPVVKVIEIQKLAEEPSREGVSVVLDDLGANNLVIVDEGHKGTGSEARVWKSRQQRLSRDGFLLEYSATFAQAIAAAGTRAREDLLHEYGKAILFDYSYAHFYGDGYGKNFRVLNLSKARASQAHELLMGGLVTFYHQLVVHEREAESMQPYNIEKPLWVMLGTSVSKKKHDTTKEAQRERTDVAEVVAFLRRVLEEPDWATEVIERILSGQSGFADKESGLDLFSPHIQYLRGKSASTVYKRILKDVFHGSGGLEVWELKNAEGEMGLRISAGDAEACPYFAIVNIGDVPAFRKHLNEHLGIEVQEDRFSGSQFEQVNRPDSRTHILIGAKKFIEGWSSWRVSSMGLLNVGKGEGPQIMQLFGRGVRLKGRGMSLKRSEAFPQAGGHPEGIEHLETLCIFGWNADYIQTFREMLESEDVGKEFTVTVKHRTPWPKDDLPVPQPKKGFDLRALTWALAAEAPGVLLDLTPQLTAVTSGKEGAAFVAGAATAVAEVAFSEGRYADLLNMDGLYRELLTYKQARGYGNVYIPRGALPEILRGYCTLRMPQDEARTPRRIQAAAEQAIKTYLDRFVRRKEREAESQHVELGWLEPDERVVKRYHVRVKANDFLAKIKKLLQKPLAEVDDAEPLPRFYVDWHLFNPILAQGGAEWKKHVSVRPPALVSTESRLVRELKAFWATHHDRPPHADQKVFLLRNLPKVGVGLFHRSGFYPDFILWLKDTARGTVHVRFIDPHGLHHGGLAANEDKFEALRKVRDLSEHPDFKAKGITLDGFVLVPTQIEQIPDRGARGWPELESEFPLLRQDDKCARRLLTPP